MEQEEELGGKLQLLLVTSGNYLMRVEFYEIRYAN